MVHEIVRSFGKLKKEGNCHEGISTQKALLSAMSVDISEI